VVERPFRVAHYSAVSSFTQRSLLRIKYDCHPQNARVFSARLLLVALDALLAENQSLRPW
jgi:hypothetical protein